MTRAALAALDAQSFDVIVVGGGVNGASAARDLSAAGYRTLVVDKGDFGSGASSRSSRLLHCGLRYLAPGRSLFDFVRHPGRFRTALRMAKLGMEARSEFVKACPERTAVMKLHFPVYRDGPYRGWQLDAAFRLLQALGPKDVPLDYERLSRAEVARSPLISGLRDQDKLASVARFREYQFDWPERVCLDAIGEAEQAGAVARNYTQAALSKPRADGLWRVTLTDLRSQAAPVTVAARSVVVTAGVWMDGLLHEAEPRAGRKIFGTKGCHIVVQLPPECRGLGVATLNSLQEPFYCLPWKHLHYFGPTETEYRGDPDRVFVTDDECDFLLREANRLFPGLGLTRSSVLFTWAGVRPLTYDENVPFGNRSRVLHDLSLDGLPNAFAMTAGPVMTHRSAGREILSAVAHKLQPSGPASRAGGAPTASPLAHAETLSDILFRRTGEAWTDPFEEDAMMRAAAEAGALLGWDEDRTRREIAAYRDEVDAIFRPGTRTVAPMREAPAA
ncbi:FAD-dependent oxidoreductase [Alsobacter soli]|uniref:FAD-dependent oxidoreductase n=1 Tax=Alsobacter soli TaxID=2109933 RepID=A0A2T1HNS6_9HYPH|nr:FAD-dependent oxidoreductase [Alsobacter soli]PSC03189.1 FAD-dependent oxidoreductase [Alsobacter soli]